jgi:hypothetical protein
VTLLKLRISGKGAWPHATGAPPFIEELNTICDGLIATPIRDCYLQGVGLKAQQKGIEIKLRAAACFVNRMRVAPLEHEIEQEAPSQGIDHVPNNTVTFA